MRKYVKIFFFVLLICAFFCGGYLMTDGFHLSKILSSFDENPAWNLTPLEKKEKEHILNILDQKFFYLGKGRQAFVFESEDGKYVIKFFNQERFRLPEWMEKIPLPSYFEERRKCKSNKREQRVIPSFFSFKLAYEKMKEETGFVFLQLNRIHQFEKPLTIVDSVRREHEIDLNNVEFVLQKKVKMIYPALEQIKKEQGQQAFEKAIQSFLNIITSRLSKGIVDDDLDVEINYGFIEDQAVLIDAGRLSEDYRVVLRHPYFRRELLKSTKFFSRWLREHHPEGYQFIRMRISQILKEHEEMVQTGDFSHQLKTE